MLKKILIILSILVFSAIAGAAWHFSSQLIYPGKPGCPEEHFLYCGDPSELKLQFEDVTFSSYEEADISGWYIPSGNSVKAIVMVHGHGATRHEGMRWVRALNSAGFNLLLIDLRSHGSSTPGPISMGYHEKKDVISAIDFLIDEKNNSSTGVFGVSMGSATGILAMAEDERIKAGVFEAGYSSLEEILSYVAKNDFGLPKFPLINVVVKFFEWRTGSDADELKPYEKIKQISPRPVFIIHCEKDNYIPYEHGLKIFESAGEPKQFWASPCDRHAQAWQGDPEKAAGLVTEFYRKHL